MVEGSGESSPVVGCQADQFDGSDLPDGPLSSEQAPWILNSLPGCQYRMTSYEERDSRADLDPAYGIHLHDPRMMEYMGAYSVGHQNTG